jgi:glyoxylase-like metal-dependent hydrolase (beta-lactamase superfamily II)
MVKPASLLCPKPEGLYCAPADFYIDPVRPVERAVITHGHSDHARAGHGVVVAAPAPVAPSPATASSSASPPPVMCWALPRRWCAGRA